MAHDFTISITPTMVTMQCPNNSAVFPSPLVGAQQTLDRGGQKWRITLTFSNKVADDRAFLMGMIVGLRGRVGRVAVPAFDNPRRGAYGGAAPKVDGASQTGSSIDLKDCDNNVTNWIRMGDYFGLAENGHARLKMATADASTNGSGLITIPFEPRIRFSPLDNGLVGVDDGVIDPSSVSSIYYLENDAQGWTSRPHTPRHLSDIVMVLVEDYF